MRAVALVVLLSMTAHAQAVPADAPTVAVVKAGDAVPFSGLLLSDAQAIAQAQRVAAAEARAKSLEDSLKTASPPWWALVIVGVVALGGGVALGFGITQATK